MSDTPRTDVSVVSREFIHREMNAYENKFVLADFARTLERENARLREAIEKLALMRESLERDGK